MIAYIRNNPGWLFLPVAAAAYLLLLISYVLPYYPYPSDDMDFSKAVNGRLPLPLPLITTTVAAFRLFNSLMGHQTVIGSGSVFDSMVMATAAANVATSFILFLIVRKARGGFIWPALAAVLYLSSEWTLFYLQFLAHAPFLAFFFCLGIYLAINLHEAVLSGPRAPSEQKARLTLKLTLLMAGYTTTLTLLVFTSSAGLFWLAAEMAFVIFLFFPFVSAAYRKGGFRALLKKGLSAIRLNSRALSIAAIPVLGGMFYFFINLKFILYQYTKNIDNEHFRLAVTQHNEMVSTLPLSVLKLIYHHMPVVSVAAGVLVLWLIARFLIARQQREKPAPVLSFPKDALLASLVGVIVMALLAAEALPFTKLARSFYPFNALICLVLVLAVSGQRIQRNYKFAANLVLAALVGFAIVQDGARFVDSATVRFGLSRFLASYYGAAEYFAFRLDVQNLAYFVPLTILASSPGRPAIKVSLINNMRDINVGSGQTAVVVVGPQGKTSGQSATNSCLYDDFMLSSNGVIRPNNSEEYVFRNSGYLESIYLEEEVCQNLFFRGRGVDVNAPDKQLVVWVIKS